MDYQLLGGSGLRVSQLCLGAMTFGSDEAWCADKAESKAMFDAFVVAFRIPNLIRLDCWPWSGPAHD